MIIDAQTFDFTHQTDRYIFQKYSMNGVELGEKMPVIGSNLLLDFTIMKKSFLSDYLINWKKYFSKRTNADFKVSP